MPDVGALIEAIRLTVGRTPDIIMGKPHTTAGERLAMKYNLPAKKIAMVGDRLYTDVAFGKIADSCPCSYFRAKPPRICFPRPKSNPTTFLTKLRTLCR